MKNLSLKQRIVTHIVYRDVFNAPVSLPELCNWLSSDSQHEIENYLTDLISENLIELHDDFYCIKGRSEIVNNVPLKRKLSAELLRENLRSLQLLRYIPFVQYVGISGSVAAGNATPEAYGPNRGYADLDIFIVTSSHALWVFYFFVRLFYNLNVYLLGGRQVLCFNYVMDSSFQEIHNKGLFTATELYNLKTIFDRQECLKNLHTNNRWAAEYYPSIKGDQHQAKKRSMLSSLFLPITFILNVFFYFLFQLSRAIKRGSLKPLLEFSFSFNPEKKGWFQRVCSGNGGYESSIRTRFVSAFQTHFPSYFNTPIVNSLFPNTTNQEEAEFALMFLKYQPEPAAK